MNFFNLKQFIPTIDNSLKRLEAVLIIRAVKSHNITMHYKRELSSIQQYFKQINYSDMVNAIAEINFDNQNFDNLRSKSRKQYNFTFQSPYKPNKYFKKDFLKIQKLLMSVKVHFFPYKNITPERKALIYIHGWGKGSLIVERLWHIKIFQKSYKADVFAIELPYHMARNPKGFSGQGFLDGDPVRTVEAFKQSIIEVIYLFKGLQQLYTNVGIAGISLGGHIAAYVSIFIEQSPFILAALAGTPFAHNLKNLRISPNLQKFIRKNKVHKFLHVIDYTNFPVNKNIDNVYLLGGRWDSIIDEATVLRLGNHLRCNTLIMPTGHFTFAFSLPYVTSKIAKWK